jgi:hypothetical protein
MPPTLEFETERHLFYSLVRTLNEGQGYDKDSLYPPRLGLPLELIITILRHAECTVSSRMAVTIGEDEFKSFQEEAPEEAPEGEEQEGEEQEGEEQEGEGQEEQVQVPASSDSRPEIEDGEGASEVEEDMHIPGAFPDEQNEGDADGSNEGDGEIYENGEMDDEGEDVDDTEEVEEAGGSTSPILVTRKADSHKVSHEVEVLAWGGGDAHEDWLKSPSFNEHDLENMHSVQLITISRDQGWTSDPDAGSWSWFDLILLQNDGTPRALEGETLAWKSHDNGPPASPIQVRPGLVFGPDHVLWRHLQSGDQICVRACARFSGWRNIGIGAMLKVMEYFVPSFVPK